MRGHKFLRRSLLLGLALLALSGCSEPAPVLPEPEQVEAAVTSAQSVTVRWSGEGTRYRIYRKAGETEDFRFIDEVAQPFYRDGTVKDGVSYAYLIQTYDPEAGAVSEGVSTQSVTLWPIPEAPVVRNEETVQVSWPDTGAQKYRVYGPGRKLLAQTEENFATLTEAPDRVAVCGVYQVEGRDMESQTGPETTVLKSSEILSITSLAKKAAAVQFSPVEDAQTYTIYRSQTLSGEYTPIATTQRTIYYDESEGSGGYYRIQPSNGDSVGPMGTAAATGLNAHAVYGVPTLMYHDFVTQEYLDQGVLFDEYAIWQTEFKADLNYLRRNGYTTITTRQLADWLEGRGELPKKPVILTIDDGKYGVYLHAYPLLKEYGMCAVLNVIGEEIDNADQDWEANMASGAPYCNWDQIAEMATSGVIEIGSHTYGRHRFSHDSGHTGADILAGESTQEFFALCQEDAQQLAQICEEKFGMPPVTMAYPYSERSPEGDQVWLDVGYQILQGGDGDGVHPNYANLLVQEYGLNYSSALLRRQARMTGTACSVYLRWGKSGLVR